METCLLCGKALGSPRAQITSIQLCLDPITHPWPDVSDPHLVRLDGISRFVGTCLMCLAQLPYVEVSDLVARTSTEENHSLKGVVLYKPRSALEYLGLGKTIITKVKFSRETRLRRLWMVLGTLALENSIHQFPLVNAPFVIIPAPGSGFGHWQRGFQPVFWLARDLANYLKVPWVPIFSHRGFQSQKLLTRVQRLTNESPIILRIPPFKNYERNVLHHIKGKEVILVDDVITTGSTFQHMVKILVELEPKAIRMITLVKD
jgi:predicted amidophosphoribosyltransferase